MHSVGLNVALALIRRRPMQPRRDIARRNVAWVLADLLHAGARLDDRRRRRTGLLAGDLLDRAMGTLPCLQRVERCLLGGIAIEVDRGGGGATLT